MEVDVPRASLCHENPVRCALISVPLIFRPLVFVYCVPPDISAREVTLSEANNEQYDILPSLLSHLLARKEGTRKQANKETEVREYFALFLFLVIYNLK